MEKLLMLVLLCFCSGFAGKFTFLSIYLINIYINIDINNIIIINLKNCTNFSKSKGPQQFGPVCIM